MFKELLPREQKCVLLFAKRILRGQKDYGSLYAGKKDWGKECLEEALDGFVYAINGLLDHEEFADKSL